MSPPNDHSVTYDDLYAHIQVALPDVTITAFHKQAAATFIAPKQIQIRWNDAATPKRTTARLIEALPGTKRTPGSGLSVSLDPRWGATTNVVFIRQRTRPSVAVQIVNDAFAGRPQRGAHTDAEEPNSALVRVAAVLLADNEDWNPIEPPGVNVVEAAVAHAEAATGHQRPDTYDHILGFDDDRAVEPGN